jgi:hypothetical protein
MSVIPALRWWTQEDLKLKANLGYIARPCLKNKETSQVHVTYACNPSYLGG